MVGGHQAVDLGCRRDLVFFVEDAAPVELGLNAIVVLDVEIVGGNELPHSGSEDGANGRDDGLLGLALIAEGDDHRAFGGKMTLVNRAGDMLLDAEEAKVRRASGCCMAAFHSSAQVMARSPGIWSRSVRACRRPRQQDGRRGRRGGWRAPKGSSRCWQESSRTRSAKVTAARVQRTAAMMAELSHCH